MVSNNQQKRGRDIASRQAAWKLAALRINKGWSQRALADAAGIAGGTVARAERGEWINEFSQKCIADVFGLEPVDIWPRETQRIYG